MNQRAPELVKREFGMHHLVIDSVFKEGRK